MVIDETRNASLYYAITPGIETALRYLASADLCRLEPGKYELDGGCFAIVQDYETIPREDKRWEAHRKYIDVQFIAKGTELMGYADIKTLRVTEAFDEAKDIEWLEGEGSFVVAPKGTFVILFPHDAHMPGVAMGEPSAIRKVVVKVPVTR